MFGARYFAPRYFAPRFWGTAAAAMVEAGNVVCTSLVTETATLADAALRCRTRMDALTVFMSDTQAKC